MVETATRPDEALQPLHRQPPQEGVRRELARNAEEARHDERHRGAQRRVGDGDDGVQEDAREEGVPVGLGVREASGAHGEVVQQPGHARGEEAGDEGEGLRRGRGNGYAGGIHVQRRVDDGVRGANQKDQGNERGDGGGDYT